MPNTSSPINSLDTNRITHFAPYKVWSTGEEYKFEKLQMAIDTFNDIISQFKANKP